ncbi:hypothetical protein Tco_0449861 [Tanacetum coccineum]
MRRGTGLSRLQRDPDRGSGDGSSSGKWKDYCMAGDDYEGPPIFDDDQFDDDYEGPLVFDDYPYEEEIVSGDVGKGFVDNYPNFQEDVTEKEERFVGKGEFGGEEENIKDVVVVVNDLFSLMIQTTGLSTRRATDYETSIRSTKLYKELLPANL